MQRRLESLTEAKAAVIDMQAVPYIDQSGAYALAELIEQLVEHETAVYIARLQPEPADLLHRLGFIPGLCREEHVFSDIGHAVRRASADAEARG